MKTKIIQLTPIILVLFAIGLRYFSRWCVDSIPACYGTWLHSITFTFTKPIFFFAMAFLPIALILAFVSRTIFQSWLRLAIWFVPLSLLIIFITPVTSNSWMPLFFVSREEVSWYLGVLFAALSLLLILCRALRSVMTEKGKWFSSRRKSGQV